MPSIASKIINGKTGAMNLFDQSAQVTKIPNAVVIRYV